MALCEHPLSDITIAGSAVDPLPEVFHALLQTIADVMMYLPWGSALQQMAVRCWHGRHMWLWGCVIGRAGWWPRQRW